MEAQSPSLTIAVPVYNDGKYLRDTLESCLKQSPRIWLYDNCSTDDSTQICAEYAVKHEHITHVLHAENLGAFENFRLSLFACKTEYFMWLGAHDLLGETYTAPLLKQLEDHKDAVLAVGKILHIDEEGQLKNKQTDLSNWSPKLQSETDPLLRMSAFIDDHFGKKHDSFLLHGIFRTEILKKAWVPQACLALDDAILARTVAYGNIVYSNDAVFYARWFHKTRKKSDEAKRIFRGGHVPETGGAMSRHILVLSIMDTIMNIAHERESSENIFPLIRKIEKKVLNPKRARRYRRYKQIGMGVCIIVAIVWCFMWAF